MLEAVRLDVAEALIPEAIDGALNLFGCPERSAEFTRSWPAHLPYVQSVIK